MYAQLLRKSLVASAATLVVLLAVFGTSTAAFCGPSEGVACEGAVRLDFDNTTCHDYPVQYYQVGGVEGGPDTTCHPVGGLYKKSVCEQSGREKVVKVETYDDSSCTILNNVEHYPAGKCFYELGAYASVWLCNVNDTFLASPGVVDQNPVSTPIFDILPSSCSSPDNCPEGAIREQFFYNTPTCSAPAVTAFVNMESTNYTFDTCLFDKGSSGNNIMLSCDHEYFNMAWFADDTCSSLPYKILRQNRSCVHVSAIAKRHMETVDGLQLTSGISSSHQRIVCPGVVPEVPVVPPTTPPSDVPTIGVPADSGSGPTSTPTTESGTPPTPTSDASTLSSIFSVVLAMFAAFMVI
jgi:hypothetical protein